MKLFDKLERYLVDDEFKVSILDNRVHIINYLEIVDFSSDRVVIRYKGGSTVISGNNLVVSKMLDDELLITGKLYSIEYK